MQRKVLFVATVDKGHILKFHVPYLKYFKEKGYEVHVACSGNADIPFCDKKHELPFERSPYKFSNITAYKALKKIIETTHFDLIHCHTPMGGVIGRLAARSARKKGTKVLYTAHGFHFFSGASTLNWLIYFPIEKYLSSYTDCLITINNEDYNLAREKFNSPQVELVHGVGVDLNRFTPQSFEEKVKLRSSYGYNEEDFILMYTAELNHNKHQDLLIEAINLLRGEIPNIKLLLAGEGVMAAEYRGLSERLDVNSLIDFLGHRKDIPELLKLSDIAVSASRREGLPVNIMEAMATGLPIVATNSRGNRDLVKHNENGFIVSLNDPQEFCSKIKELYKNDSLRKKFGKKNVVNSKTYSLQNIILEMDRIYSRHLQ
ncbi:glycosyl transferase [Bacillus sp. FJAT-27225]|uniref:glycosyltransferase family 4 protein n=1 Tax=Bacillus sp. FJAT-27225 TaxID=1743144 RepID=UPI00080C2EDC|nr:glycosyltransferase family 4 protein [Bacillus sp. FJAT-27225]OCA88294.1 glycosyl transferase [Bacillus sp. FJAT-27225]